MYERIEVIFKGGSIRKISTSKSSETLEGQPIPERKKEVTTEDAVPTYLVGSRFITDCYRFLMKHPTEVLHDVSGVKHNGVYTMERLDPLELDESSSVYARSNLLSTRDSLMDMHRFGYLLTGVFHSHPGNGPSSTNPSDIDVRNQKKLEYAGYKCLSAVFSRDGYVRFFSVSNPFKVVVRGRGVDNAGEENLFRITGPQEL